MKRGFTCAEHRRLAKWAKDLGWTWEIAGGGHIRWRHPDVAHPVFTGATPTNPALWQQQYRHTLARTLQRARQGRAA